MTKVFNIIRSRLNYKIKSLIGENPIVLRKNESNMKFGLLFYRNYNFS